MGWDGKEGRKKKKKEEEEEGRRRGRVGIIYWVFFVWFRTNLSFSSIPTTSIPPPPPKTESSDLNLFYKSREKL